MSSRKSILAGLISFYAICGGFALTGAPANAAAIHNYLSEITEVPAGPGVSDPGPFELMQSMTVDSGHLWVAENTGGASRADEFDASTGAFISQFVPPASLNFGREGGGIAVDHANGTSEIYAGATNAANESVVAVFDEAGSLQATWTGLSTPGGSFGSGSIEVAVDNSTSPLDPAAGDVYVDVPSQKVIDIFHPEIDGEEHYVGQITGASPTEPFVYPAEIAVNESSGDLIVLDNLGESSAIEVLEPAMLGEYTLAHKITDLSPGRSLKETFNIAVDSSNGEIYVTEGFEPVVIDEFSATGTYLGGITGADSPGENIKDVYSLAVDSPSNDVYIADNRGGGNSAVKIFGPDRAIPDVTTGSPVGLTARGVTLTGTVDPDKAGAGTCQFVWGTTTEFGQTAPCSMPTPEGESPTPVEAHLSGLEPDTTYYYLLHATNVNGTNYGESFQVQNFTTPGPKLDAEAVSAVTAGSVTFDATINPHKTPTTYYFQYGTTGDYSTDVPAPPGFSIGSGEGGIEVSQHVQGLKAGTIYHYRVVSLSDVEPGELEEFDGPDQTFTTQEGSPGGLTLLDGRTYELVTPAAKEGALIYGQNWGQVQNSEKPLTAHASADGDAIVDLASRPTEAEPMGNAVHVSLLSTRGPSGWSSQVIAPAHNEATFVSINNGGEYRFFSEDLSQGIAQPFGNFTPLSPEASESTAYLHTDYLNGNPEAHCQASCFQPLVTAANTPKGTVFGETLGSGQCSYFMCGPLFVDATPDLSHVILASPAQLTSVSAPEGGLYEWYEGRLRLISAPPEGQTGVLRLAGASVNDEVGGVTRLTPGEYDARHAISDDGARVILAGDGLYLRDVATGELVRLDVTQGGASTSTDPAYMTANTDASRIFFLDNAGLTSSSSSSGTDLYEYDLDASPSRRLTDLTADSNVGEAADVTSVFGASDDGSYVYFAAGGMLAPGAVDGKCTHEGISGYGSGPVCNLYVLHDGVTKLVAADWNAESSGERTARVSRDGSWFAFMSNRDLAGYDTHDAMSDQSDQEVYLYDADAGKLVCASCNPTGARPVGVRLNQSALVAGSLLGGTWAASSVPPLTGFDGREESRYQPRYLSDSGRMFFDSNDALVPQDVNGTQDVYEYEPAGVGTCNASTPTFGEDTNGCVDLISSGSSAEEAAFMDASETGGDVFFITSSKLVSQDFDNALDVYDAHECTTSAPCYPVPPAVPPVCSTGDACKAAPTPQPSIFGAAPSATFSGRGNVSPPTSVASVKPKSLTRAQKLAQALRVCRKKGRKQRAVCEVKARKRFGPVGKSHKANAKRKGRG
ncbi:MAG TPA: hypothetical protein VIJ39_05750 [Solirubrobacteraceae bacterium]